MERQFSSAARICAAIISVSAFAALGVQIAINDGPALIALALIFRFFTIWSNFAAAIIMGWVALGRRTVPQALLSLATALAIVALVYHLLLAKDHHPLGWDWYTNQMHHTIIPAATVLWWLAFSDTRATSWHSVWAVAIAPLVYTAFALVVGWTTGFYPYFFTNLPELGLAQYALNIAGLGLVFLAFGALLLGLRKLISARA